MSQIRVGLAVQNCILGAFEANLAQTLETARNAAQKGVKILVFPEMNLTGYAAASKICAHAKPLDPQWMQHFSDLADEKEITILTGLAERTDTGRIRATHLVFSPHTPPGIYRKVHLAPQEKEIFTPGSSIPIFETQGIRFGIQLCYDAHFPELSQAMALDRADIIFIPHASPRGTPEDKLHSWLRHLTARAFDNGVYIAAVNQTGDNKGGLSFPGLSLVIGPDGYLDSTEATGEPDLILADLDMAALESVRSHKMRYFLPNRRPDLFGADGLHMD